MKWNFFCMLIINLMIIGCIACGFACGWHFPPHPPIPLELWEDHYMRISHGPYASSIPHIDSSHGEALSEPESMDHHIFYPMNHMQHIVSAEPEERLLEESPLINMRSNKREFVGYSQREPVLRLHNGNYRYRKRIRIPRPFNQKAFHHKQEVKYQTGFGHQPRRYNAPDLQSNSDIKQNFPNSVNDKLSQKPKKGVVLEEESNRQNQNSSNNINNDNNINIKNDNNNNGNNDKGSKDNQVIGSQTNADIKSNGLQSIAQNLDMPIEITSYAMRTPDGAVTQVTEMLYDVANNPFRVSSPTPIVSPFLPPSTTAVITATDDPRATQTPYLDTGYSESEAGSGPRPPFDSAVTAKIDGITMSPVVTWTSQRSTIRPVTTWTIQQSLPAPTPPRLVLSTAPSESGTRRHRKRLSTQRPSTTTNRNSPRESESGLSGAAIAGIVIGSMVSVMLLAGTSLFVMYRNPFRRAPQTTGSAFEENSLPNVLQTNDPNTIPRVHRWPPRRQRR